jgi:GNAT superfamily N-acetyltransferase
MQPSNSIRSYPLYNEADFWRVRDLLIESYPVTPLGFNWEIRRWDGKRFYEANPQWPGQCLAGRVQLWETKAGRLVGVVIPDGEGDAHLQLHPDFRHLEAEMVTWAEDHLACANSAGERQLEIFVYEYDVTRQQLLVQRGYSQLPDGGVIRRLHLPEHPLDPPLIAPGYTIRTTHPDDLADCQRIADLLNAAFNRTFHNALEYQNFTRLAPSFCPTLDLVAVAPAGLFAAYVGIPYDKANRHGIFEPVCTHPDHRLRGLARTLMIEGLQRLRAMGATDATVETGDMIPANRLYDSIGFCEVCKGHVWRKVF